MKKPDLVKVTWTTPEIAAWPYFHFLATLPEGWVKLKGADYPDRSAKHEGSIIIVHRSELKEIEVIG